MTWQAIWPITRGFMCGVALQGPKPCDDPALISEGFAMLISNKYREEQPHRFPLIAKYEDSRPHVYRTVSKLPQILFDIIILEHSIVTSFLVRTGSPNGKDKEGCNTSSKGRKLEKNHLFYSYYPKPIRNSPLSTLLTIINMKVFATVSTIIFALAAVAVAAPNPNAASNLDTRAMCDGAPPGYVLCDGDCRKPEDC
ncbi:hypothetical protein PHISCL_03661 [Aspergillus sclerotialis]|uniref:Uncharacterized protein n=1 Tax=Aspergillus sclerotialis TaxID=2070753 RepID=A0A3A2ZLT1_9EURO|nr:hypothetical protein PHISCL_03661 [Aspergillus sclerotialis]